MNEVINSAIVNKEIKHKIWPVLKSVGFSKFTTRSAWRLKKEIIEVVNFQSFNSYLAFGIGSTTFSFAVNLGIYFRCYEATPWFRLKKHDFPKEYETHLRKQLEKQLSQPDLFKPYNDSSNSKAQKDRREIWYVKGNGSNLDEAINDAKNVIISEGYDWFDRMSDLQSALTHFQVSTVKKGKISWAEADIISALALKLNRKDIAIKAYEGIINNPYYQRIKEYSRNKSNIPIVDFNGKAQERIKIIKTG